MMKQIISHLLATVVIVQLVLVSTVLAQGNGTSSQFQLCRFGQQFKAVYFSWNTANPQGTYFNRTYDAVNKKLRDDFFIMLSQGLTKVVEIADYSAGKYYVIINGTQCIYATIDSGRDIELDYLRCIPASTIVTKEYRFGKDCDTTYILAVVPSQSLIIYNRMYGLLESSDTGPTTNPTGSPAASTSVPAQTSSPNVPFPTRGKRKVEQENKINVQYPFFSDIVFVDPNQGNTTVLQEEWLNYEILTSVDQSVFDVSSLKCEAAPSGGSGSKSRSGDRQAQHLSWSLNEEKRTLAEMVTKMKRE